MPNATLSESDVAACDRSGMAALIASWPAQIQAQRAALAARPWPAMPARRCSRWGAWAARRSPPTSCSPSRPTACRSRPSSAATTCGRPRCGPARSRCCRATPATPRRRSPSTTRRRRAGWPGWRSPREANWPAAARPTGPLEGRSSGPSPPGRLGYSVVSLSLVLEALGDPGFGDAAWAEAHAVAAELGARCAPDRPEAENPAKSLARAVVGRAVCVYGGVGLAAPVARRWKGQFTRTRRPSPSTRSCRR